MQQYRITGNFCGFGLKWRHLIFADFFFCGLKILAPKFFFLYYRKQQQKWCYDKQLVHITVILRSKNIFSSLESFQRIQLLNMHLVNFELSFHLFRDLFCWQEIRSTVGSISVKYLIFRIYFFGQILILYHITFF